ARNLACDRAVAVHPPPLAAPVNVIKADGRNPKRLTSKGEQDTGDHHDVAGRVTDWQRPEEDLQHHQNNREYKVSLAEKEVAKRVEHRVDHMAKSTFCR